MTSVVIENDYQNTVSEEVKAPADPNALTTEEMIEIVKNAGIVGMGGATFPTHVKISGGIGQVTTVIINGAECEPYITGDHRAMLERTEEIIGGASYLVKMFGVDKAIIGVEDNKKNGIDALNRVIAETKAPVIVVPLHCRYPQGGEKQLCQAITGKQVPPGGLPSAIGCAVLVLVNVLLVPRIGYMACAWGGLVGYGTCVLLSYFIGQRHYRVPYPVPAILGWVALALALYAASTLVHIDNLWLRLAYNTLLLLVFLAALLYSERVLVSKVVGKLSKRK